MNASRIAFFAAFNPLRPGAEKMIAPLIREARVFLNRLGETIAYENVVKTLDEGKSVARKLLSKNPDVFAVFVTGGTERIVQFVFRDINIPVILLACDRANSLPAALEMLPRLRDMGKDVKLIFAKEYDENVFRALESFLVTRKVVRRLKETTLGLFGSPSPWLIGCTTDYRLLEDKFGLTIKRLDLLTLYKEYKEISHSDAEDVAKRIFGNVGGLKETSYENVVEATRMYLAAKKIVEKEALDALAVKCFEIIPVVNNTACLMVSKLVDEGVIAGCEGDLNATVSMILLNYLTNQPVWMANPASVDYERNTLTLAHCTLATSLVSDPKKIVLRTHFESGRGISIQGPVKKGKVTLIRLGGPRLDKMMILSGQIVDTDMNYGYMCRTQVEVELNGSVVNFLDESLGNHLAMVPGDVVDRLVEVCDLLQIKLVMIS
jgi:L-fucose isomerase-like protein